MKSAAKKMTYPNRVSLSALLFVAFVLTPILSYGQDENPRDIDIVISPSVLVVENDNIEKLVIHADILAIDVDVEYPILLCYEDEDNCAEIEAWWADDCGNFVAMFTIEDVKALGLTCDDYTTLTMDGSTNFVDATTGEIIFFHGADDIYVKCGTMEPLRSMKKTQNKYKPDDE